ncbi:MAG: DinB family protein [Clostridia bacterium]|nr:DinB family protein [Clostridia bacterium]MCL6522715.1 DinB family protein [Bacillota bacterium]
MTPDEMVEGFLRHRRATQAIARLMPDERFDDHPWEGGRSFGELLLHIVDSADAMLGGAAGQPVEPPAERPSTPAAIRAYLEARTPAQETLVRALAADPRGEVRWRDAALPAEVLLARAREHEAHHKGQLMLLARMAGVREAMFYVAT